MFFGDVVIPVYGTCYFVLAQLVDISKFVAIMTLVMNEEVLVVAEFANLVDKQ